MPERAPQDRRFFCPQPILSMRVAKRKGEKWSAYNRRFERWQERFGRLLALRTKLEDL
ncbi:hypothetical protein ACLBYG_22615 [Methylobacterium sp. D53M]